MFRQEIIERYTELYGRQYFNSCSTPVKKSIRVNTLKIRPEKLFERMKKQRFVLKQGMFENSFVIERERKMLGGTIEHMLGYYYVQEETSMIPPTWLNPKPGETVLDMSAAPGGKTTHLSELMNNEGIIIAVDSDEKKNASMINNLQRMGCKNVYYDNNNSMSVERMRKYGMEFDKVLIDAPCSGSGIIYKDPTVTYRLSIDYINHYAKKQKLMISTAHKLMKPKARLVYSTCSIDPLENDEVIAHAESTGFRLLRKQQFLPHKNKTAGFFVAEMIKR